MPHSDTTLIHVVRLADHLAVCRLCQRGWLRLCWDGRAAKQSEREIVHDAQQRA